MDGVYLVKNIIIKKKIARVSKNEEKIKEEAEIINQMSVPTPSNRFPACHIR